MFATLRGTVMEIQEDHVVLEVGGVGYSVMVSASTRTLLGAGQDEVLLYTAESVAMYGGGMTLYGFLRREDREVFNAIRDNVSGTGAKKALDLADKAVRALPDFKRAIIDKDPATLVSIGYTQKTAEKIISGLHRKIQKGPFAEVQEKGAPAAVSGDEEALQGLLSLGYKEPLARAAVRKVQGELGKKRTAQDVIRAALKHLSVQTS